MTDLFKRPGSGRLFAVAVIVLWMIPAGYFLFPTDPVSLDIAGGRQADTQTIARHFTEPGANLFYPRIDWGGDGPGYVETELQLYTWLMSLILRVTGDVEWPGALISLVSVGLAAYFLFVDFRTRLGFLPAAVGMGVFLASPGVAFAGTLVQPDALALLPFVISWVFFIRYVEEGTLASLIGFGVLGAIAMLIKPTMIQIGVASFLLVLLMKPERLRRPGLWACWVLMLVPLILHVSHAYTIFRDYGNSFGVLSGYDSKMPKLDHLLMPNLLFQAANNMRRWGTGPIGALVLVAALARPRAQATTFALFVGSVIWTVATLRFTSGYGTHYLLVSTVVVAYAAAQTMSTLRPKPQQLVAAVMLFLLPVVMYRAGKFRWWWPNEDASRVKIAALSQTVTPLVHPNDLVIFRADTPRYDEFWRTYVNFNDPRLFRLTGTRGWVIASDEASDELLESYRQRGARFYVSFTDTEPATVAGWLAGHAQLAASTQYGGRVFALAPGNTR